MKKSAFLLAGVAALALSATAVSAQTVRIAQKGQQTIVLGFNIPAPAPVGPVDSFLTTGFTLDVPGVIGNGPNLAKANDGSAINPAWHGVALSVGNVGGNGDASDKATFTLSGEVTKDCALYTGTSQSLAFDFGQIGVYVSDNTGPAAAFTMVAPAALNFDTNLAGCNTPNSIKIQKTDLRGLVNNNGGGYDSNVFQANLPYSVTAKYTAASGTGIGTGSLQTLTVGTNADQNTAQHGAWKSNLDLEVVIPQAQRALLAGEYEGEFSVTIAVL